MAWLIELALATILAYFFWRIPIAEADLGGGGVQGVRTPPFHSKHVWNHRIYAVRNSDTISCSIVYLTEPYDFVLSLLVPSCPSAM